MSDAAKKVVAAAKAFAAVKSRIDHGNLRPWGREYKRVVRELLEACDELDKQGEAGRRL